MDKKESGYNTYGIFEGGISPLVNTFPSNQGLVSNIVSDPITPDSIVDGQLSSNIQQEAGNIFNGKTKFDNSQTGYILGVDITDTLAKFYIGNTVNYLNWTGTELIISGNISATTGTIGGFTIGATTITANNLVLDSSGQRISLGSGNDIVILDADDATYRLWVGNATAASAPFSVTKAGVLNATGAVISGNITATTGTIGGWVINTTSLIDAAGVVGMSSEVTGGDDIRFFAGNIVPASAPFQVTESGILTASSAVISGSITSSSGTIGGFIIETTDLKSTTLGNTTLVSSGTTAFSAGPTGSPTFIVTQGGVLTASAGTIGGFTITATTLYGGIIKTANTVSAGNTGVIMDTAGLRGYDSVLGLTFNLPTDGSPPTFSSGIISETIYEINTNAVLRTSSTVGDGTSSSAGILINDTGLYGCQANQLLADANVKVLVDGTATFNASIRGGQTDFNTGTGYFLGLSGGDYKFSIGVATGNYMTWDGTFLKLRGSFDVGATGLINNAVYTFAGLPVAATSVGFNVPSAFE